MDEQQNQATLEQQVAALKAALKEQDKRVQYQDAQLKKIKGELIAQDHRFITAWATLIHSIVYKEEREHFRDALKAVLFLFVPGTKSTIVLGASVVGVLTLVLMFQSNQLIALQNQYLQEQIYIQAESDRRDQLVNIMEKIHEPTETSLNAQRTFDALSQKEQEGKVRPTLEPKYNAPTRSQSVLSYLSIQQKPLRTPVQAKLPTLVQVGQSLWHSIWYFSEPKVVDDVENEICSGFNRNDSFSVVLHKSLLSEVILENVCLKEMNLWHSDLRGANLAGSILEGANLYGADLRNSTLLATLDGASLEKANLQRAMVWGADLIRVNLKDANLEGADLRWAGLEDANLQGANLKDANLTGAKNLTCEQLTSAVNWEQAKTDLKCTAPVTSSGASGSNTPASP